jgi:membrane protease YdiL (CAAX protease family)
MTPPPRAPNAPGPNSSVPAGNATLGIVLRVGFFIATVFVAVRFLMPVLYVFFGLQIAGTIGLAAAGLTANLLTMAIFDRRPFVDIGLRVAPASALHLALGIGLGGGAAALLLLAPLLAGTGHLLPRPHSEFTWPTLAFYLVTLFFAAAGEEMIFRGYAFQFLIEKIGPFACVLPVGVIFGLVHTSNPSATWLSVLNTALWGVLLGYAFLRSRDLWLPIGMHFGWNAVLPLFGVNLSGLTIEVTRYFYKWDLTPLWSGGAYGPEGGLLTTIFATVLFFALHLMPIHPQWAAIAKSLNEPDLEVS